MNFIVFNTIILISGLLAILLFSIGFILTLLPMALFAKSENPPRAFMISLMGCASIYQIYFWGFWSAFCVAMIIEFTQQPEVIWDWLYWLTGFVQCTALIAWVAFKECQSNQSLTKVEGIEAGTIVYSLIAIAAFLVFSVSPPSMLRPYNWALTPLGLQDYIAPQNTNNRHISESQP